MSSTSTGLSPEVSPQEQENSVKLQPESVSAEASTTQAPTQTKEGGSSASEDGGSILQDEGGFVDANAGTDLLEQQMSEPEPQDQFPQVAKMTLVEVALALQTTGERIVQIKDQIAQETARLKEDLANEETYMGRLEAQLKQTLAGMNVGGLTPDMSDFITTARKNTRRVSNKDQRRQPNPIRNLQLSAYRTLWWGHQRGDDYDETVQSAINKCKKAAKTYPQTAEGGIPPEVTEYIRVNAPLIFSGEKPIRMSTTKPRESSASIPSATV